MFYPASDSTGIHWTPENDPITDYSALVGQDFVAYSFDGNINVSNVSDHSLTVNDIGSPVGTWTVMGWTDGATNGLGYDTIQLSYDHSGVVDYEIMVVGHSADGIVGAYSYDTDGTEYWNGIFTVLTNLPEGSSLTISDNSTAMPFGVVCFAEGTRVATPAGDVAVEALSEGDLVLTVSGEERPIKWVGQMTVRPSRHPHPWEVNPVVVRAGAFGENTPARDVRLSPGHAVYVEGVLIPVGQLVNGATIVQEEVDEIRYFHIELDSHDVLMAEGLPCESYLDDGNRSSFANAEGVTVLNGRLDPKSWDEACAPMVAAGPQLEEVQRRLIARAEELGWAKVEEPNLCLVADGAVIEPMRTAGERAWFLVPACAELTLASNAAVVAQLMPGVTDQRRLGVAVSEVKVDGEALDLANRAAFRKGFYKLETHEDAAWRWTNGEGRLAVSLTEPAVVEVRLHMAAPAWKRAASQLKLAQVA